ncbi:MAG: response regulator [Phycisphaerae bacterium]|nr:response regulator [Phycisphaerae bacterium]
MQDLKPILILDDDYAEQVILKRAFEDLKISNPLVCLADGIEALSYLRETNNARPIIILTDLNMLQMNAFEFLKVIKTDEVLRQIPIIILSGSDNENEVTECFKLGAAGYMVKPLEYKNLLELIGAIHRYWTLSELPSSSLNYRVDSFDSPRVVVKQ